MLAGRMKLSHFVILAIVLVAAGIFGLTKACGNDDADDVPPPAEMTARPQPVQPTPTPVQPTPTPANPTPTTDTKSDLAARSHDAEVIAWSKRSISGDKIKDATKGKSWKLNLYKDAGNTTVNRAKVDLDRDDKFDEKYTFETSKITLQVAPADDEKYTLTYHWNGSGWTKE